MRRSSISTDSNPAAALLVFKTSGPCKEVATPLLGVAAGATAGPVGPIGTETTRPVARLAKCAIRRGASSGCGGSGCDGGVGDRARRIGDDHVDDVPA
ncbi:MAG: hypothetical protein ACK5ZS_01625 [bacterium]|jgi:hypothetical protein